MSARSRILGRIRAATLPEVAHPGRYVSRAPAPADWDRFAAALRAAGGEAWGPVPRAELPALLSARLAAQGPGRVVCEPAAANLLGPGPWEVTAPATAPAAFADVAVAVAKGSLGVAEDGAVALEAGLAPDRALLFLCERLVLLLDAERIVADLHAALERLGPAAAGRPHVTWVAGPSKTSDIEQTLVMGAHGPRALDVLGFREHAASGPLGAP
jgi:L-lactate dehydrogenase complex protein LldG